MEPSIPKAGTNTSNETKNIFDEFEQITIANKRLAQQKESQSGEGGRRSSLRSLRSSQRLSNRDTVGISCVSWGGLVDTVDDDGDSFMEQQLVMGCTLHSNEQLHELVVVELQLPRIRTCALEDITGKPIALKDTLFCKHIRHPGIVRNVDHCKQNFELVATSGDFSSLCIWNVESQPTTSQLKDGEPTPDLMYVLCDFLFIL